MTRKAWRSTAAGAMIALLLAACSESDPSYFATGSPPRLSDWNLFELVGNQLLPAESSLVFRPANQLFNDYAHKLRTLWIPDGSQAQLLDGEIDYPVGTVLSKTFYYPLDAERNHLLLADSGTSKVDLLSNQLIETRLLVRRAAGWAAFPYVWNEEQTEAFLRVAGASKAIDLKSDTGNLEFVYFVPNENQCSGCHTTSHPDGGMHPLGAVATQLSSMFEDVNGDLTMQTERLVARGWLSQVPIRMNTLSWQDQSYGIDARAGAYLNIHCGHCHNPEGAADTSALLLDGSHTLSVHMGVCKPPVAAGGGTGNLQYSIVPGEPEQSILLYRMQSTAPDEMMPELGRSLIHIEGIELIRRWIAEMPGSC